MTEDEGHDEVEASAEGLGMSSLWDSDDAIAALKMERIVTGDSETNEQLTKRILEQAGPLAAQRIVHIAAHGTNENTALRAATYITDLVYGDDSGRASKATWELFVAEAVSQAELHANVGSGN